MPTRCRTVFCGDWGGGRAGKGDITGKERCLISYSCFPCSNPHSPILGGNVTRMLHTKLTGLTWAMPEGEVDGY